MTVPALEDRTLTELLLDLEPDEFDGFVEGLDEEGLALVDEALKQAYCLLDPEGWCKDYLANAFPLPFGLHHWWLLSRLSPQPIGMRAFAGAPRGSGKTSVALFANPIRALAMQSHRFIVLVAATQTEANARLEMIARELRRNDRLLQDYPALRILQDIEGTLVLEGGRIAAIGAMSSLRGLVRSLDDGTLIRPELFLFDDLESPEQARSKLRTDRLEEWLMADVSNLGGPGEEMTLDVFGIGTTLEADALAMRMLRRRGRFAGWDVASFPAEYRNDEGERVASWPTGQPLSRLDQLLTPGSETFVGAYTYSKEYLLDPMDREDAPVKRAWIRYGDPPEGLAYRSVGIDPAASVQDQRSGDYSAMVEAGLDPEGYVWITRAWRGWVSKRRLFDLAEEWSTTWQLGERVDTATIAYEAVSGFGWGVEELRMRGLKFRAVNPGASDKLERLQRIALMYEAGVIKHARDLEGSDFEAELLTFPGAHDDLVDALIYAVLHTTNAGRRQRRVAEDKEDEPTPPAVAAGLAAKREDEARRQRARQHLARVDEELYGVDD